MKRGRQRCAEAVIPKQNMRAVLKRVKQGKSVWFLPDQAHRGANSTMAEFFGIPAPSNTTPSRISEFCQCSVVPYLVLRKPDNSGYTLEIMEALDAFPSGDTQADARRVNAMFEDWIRRAPGQYMWIHRRFKGELKDDQSLYAS